MDVGGGAFGGELAAVFDQLESGVLDGECATIERATSERLEWVAQQVSLMQEREAIAGTARSVLRDLIERSKERER